MNAPTIVVGLIILAILVAIVARGMHNKRQHKGGCSCGCGDCPGNSLCHPDSKS